MPQSLQKVEEEVLADAKRGDEWKLSTNLADAKKRSPPEQVLASIKPSAEGTAPPEQVVASTEPSADSQAVDLVDAREVEPVLKPIPVEKRPSGSSLPNVSPVAKRVRLMDRLKKVLASSGNG